MLSLSLSVLTAGSSRQTSSSLLLCDWCRTFRTISGPARKQSCYAFRRDAGSYTDPRTHSDGSNNTQRPEASAQNHLVSVTSGRRPTDYAKGPIENADQPQWKRHRARMKSLFPEGWNPPRKLDRSDMNTIRRLHAVDDVAWSTPSLAEKFRVSPEAIRRILKSKWRSDDEVDEIEVASQLERIADAAVTNVRQHRRLKIWRDADMDNAAHSGLRSEPKATQHEHVAQQAEEQQKNTIPPTRHIPLSPAFQQVAAGRTAKWRVAAH